MTDADIITAVITREGGFLDDAADSGGPTRWGITQSTLSAWRGRAVDTADVAKLTQDEAREILTARYVTEPGFDKIADDTLRAEAVDAAVNHGPARAIRWVQAITSVAGDGLLGPATAAAINALPVRAARAKFIAARCRYYGEIIARNPTQAKFAAGWMNRLAGFIEQLV